MHVTRQHEFCYGHRVFAHEGKCAHFHGHGGVVSFTCEADSGALDAIGRVIDFSVMKDRLCAWLEDNWDHRMLLWEGDPLLGAMRDLDPFVTAVAFNPTAENLAQHLVDIVGPRQLAGTGVRLTAVTFHETAKCSATYTAPT